MTPAKTKTKTAVLPEPQYVDGAYTVADFATAKSVTTAAIHRDLHRQRTGKPGVVPPPDAPPAPPHPLARTLTWAVDRPDVRAFLDPTVVVWR